MRRSTVARGSALRVAGLACAALSMPATARADATVCIDAHEQAQVLRNEGRHAAARVTFEICARPECPEPIRSECVELGQQLATQRGSVRLQIRRDGRGEPAQVTVFVDGVELSSERAAQPIELDPGVHVIRVVAADGRTKEVSVDLAPGQKDRSVVADFAATAAPEPPNGPAPPAPVVPPDRQADGPSYLGPIVMAIIGGAGLIGFGASAVVGKDREKKLDECKPRCEKEDYDRMMLAYGMADGWAALAVIALPTALIWWLAIPDDEPQQATGLSVGMAPPLAPDAPWSFSLSGTF